MNMHWCTGKLNLSGQNFTVVVFNKVEPISWPEAQVLMALHGEENLYELKPCAVSETTARAEKERLLLKYGGIAEKVFPGYSPRMETLMPGEPEDQQRANETGKPLSPSELLSASANGNGEDDDEEGDDDDKGVDPPAGPAVFKPGKHQPPRKEA
jgi:hypothetical protein